MSDQQRLSEEAGFADAEYSSYVQAQGARINPGMLARYQDARQMWDWRQRAARSLGDIRNKKLLDYGCGQGEEAAYFASLGARVTAIDISEVGIRIGRERAGAHHLDIRFEVMTCTPTTFADNSFDAVHGMGILHHVGLTEGLAEVHRVLKPGGVAVFLEPLGSSPLIERLKRRIHGSVGRRLGLMPVTSGEENLKLSEISRETASWSFGRIYPYRLTYRARKLFLPRGLWDWSLRFDSLLLAGLPPLRHFAGAAVIQLKK